MADDYGGWESDAAPVQSPSPTYRSSADGRLVSLSMPSPGVSAAAFLALAEGQERFFWEDVRDDILFAGFGVAAHLLAWGPERFRHIEEQARALFGDALLLGRGQPAGGAAPLRRLCLPRRFHARQHLGRLPRGPLPAAPLPAGAVRRRVLADD
jgi:hypothetical protein